MTPMVRALEGAYRFLLRLYPAPFRETFADEMLWVFVQSLADAGPRPIAVIGLLWREFGDMPTVILMEHIRHRRKRSMNLIAQSSDSTARLVRWAARIISVLVAAFFLSLWLFNEDVRQDPNVVILTLSALSVVMLLAWRFEIIAGQALMLGGLLAPVMTLVYNLTRPGTTPLVVPLILASLLLGVPFFVMGAFFFGVGRQAELAGEGAVVNEGQERRSRWLVIGALGLLAVALVGMLLFGFVAPVRETTSPQTPVIEYEYRPAE